MKKYINIKINDILIKSIFIGFTLPCRSNNLTKEELIENEKMFREENDKN